MNITDVLNQFRDFRIEGKEPLSFTGKLIKQDENVVLECYIDRTLVKTEGKATPNMIHGTVNCKKITLFSSYCVKSYEDISSNKVNALFLPNEIIVRYHYESENIKLKEIESYYTDLENWFMFCAFEPTHGKDNMLANIVPTEDVTITDDICNIHFNFSFKNYYEIVMLLLP